MYKLSDRITAQLKTFPNQAVIWEIIENSKTGKIFNLNDQAILLIENDNEPLAFIAGDMDAGALEKAVDILTKYQDPILYCDLIYHPFFVKKNWKFHLRVEFTLEKFTPLEIIKEQVKIIAIDTKNIFDKCLQYISLLKYGSLESFLENAMGYVLFIGEAVGAVVYATTSQNYAEINIATNPEYQEKGYATQLVTYFINKCYENNITPIWSCEVNNIASYYTALKLGFVPKLYYTTITPSLGNVLCPDLAKWLRTSDEYQ